MACILLIDDNPTIQKVFSRFLDYSGYDVLQAENGREGIECVQNHRPDLIITDILMPEMDGLEFLIELRGSHPGIPVITMSGGLRDESGSIQERAKTYGAHHVLEKPVPLQTLLKTVKELLGESQPVE